MRSSLYLLFLFLVINSDLFSQELIPFYDREKQKYGFQNKETQQIIIQPQFDYAVGWWKDYGIVMIEGKYGLIDKSGNKASLFIHDYIFVEPCEECNKGALAALFYYGIDYSRERKFYINEKCDCVPQPYYPCPPMVKMDTSSTAVNLKYIQRAEYWYHRGEIDKALRYAEKAIETDSADGSGWFWVATHKADAVDILIAEDPEILIARLDADLLQWTNGYGKAMMELENALAGKGGVKISEEEYQQQVKELNVMDSSEHAVYKRRLKSVDSIQVFYNSWMEQGWNYWNSRFDTSYHLKKYYDGALRHQDKTSSAYFSTLAGKYEMDFLSKTEKKKIAKELKTHVDRYNRKSVMSVMIHPGYSFFPFQKAEVNIMYGYSDFVFQQAFPFMAAIGAGYEYGIDMEIQTYKIMASLNPIGPLYGGLNFLYTTGFDKSGFGFRPEFGFTFSAITVLYGFNIISDIKFPGAKGNMVSVRLNLPVWRMNEFRKDLGNNLYR